MNATQKAVNEAEQAILELEYTVSYECTNKNKPNQIQQMWVYNKNGKVVAKVSLMIACRINTMFHSVGKDESKLLDILVKLSRGILNP